MNDMHKVYRIPFVLVLLISLIPILVSSCTGESQLNKKSDNATTVRINMQIPVQKNILTRTQTLSENESTVNDMTVLIFNSDKQLIGYSYSTNPTPTNNAYQMTVSTREATDCTVYVVANAGANAFTTGNSTVSGVSNPVNTMDEFTVAYAKLSTASDLGSQSNVIMSGVLTSQDITASTQTLATIVPLYRLCTKINLNIKPSSNIKITGYQLHEVPTSSYITDRSAETAPAYNPSNSYNDFDKVTESNPTNGSEVTSTYYIYENLAGTVSASNTAKTRNSKNAPATATYLDVYATGSNWQSTYRIYLGGTGTTDYTNYNIPRNYNYTYTINITGSGVYDVRVTCYPELINSPTGGTWNGGGSATAVTSSATATPGNYYFSDGTWGTLENNSGKTPIAVIFSGTTSSTDQGHGWTHGYAMALTNASTSAMWAGASYQSTDEAGDTYSSFSYKDYTGTYDTFIINKDGYSETHAISSKAAYSQSNYPTFWYALNYGTTAPNGSSGWYLPSIGQWWDIVINLAGISATEITASNIGWCRWCYGENGATTYYSSLFVANINKYMTAVNKLVTPDYFSESYPWYWSSTEYSSNCPYRAYFSAGNLRLGYSDDNDKSTTKFITRPVIAF